MDNVGIGEDTNNQLAILLSVASSAYKKNSETLLNIFSVSQNAVPVATCNCEPKITKTNFCLCLPHRKTYDRWYNILL